MAEKGFTHLHLHTQYSLLDGAITADKLFGRCKELGMDSVAMTDHGNMFGAIEFYTKALRANIKPIIGIEAYIAPNSRFDKQKCGIKDASFHLVLLAENNTGYHNLLKLASIGYTEGFYYRPRIDKQILAELNEGLICTSACISGEIASALARGDKARAQSAVDSYLNIFGPDRFFVEIQEHQDSHAPHVRGELIDLAKSKGIGMVATNDVHFLDEQDYKAHDVFCCISTGKKLSDDNRMQYPPDVYLRPAEQMRELFADVPQACDNTLTIAQRCNVEIDLKTRHAPKFTPKDGSSAEELLTKLCYEGAKKRYGEISEQVKQRLDRELEVIEGKGFSSYFLIVWDFCKYAGEHNIPVGARGSGVGTVVGYCLGLCDVDPIRYDLLFERFMDPQRNEMPDIDIDMCQDGRGRIIDYVRQKYGEVAQIITFGTLKARAVIRDVCRVMDVPLSEADRLAKLVPATLGMTLDKAIKTEPELAKLCREDERTGRAIEICRKLEGLVRHAGVHAAGVVIADEPLTNFIPLYKASGSDDIITQFEGPVVEKVGLLKMDFLGLRTLSVIQRAIELVEEIHGTKIDIEKIDLTDAKVLKLFANGQTKGVFQFESGGMADLLMKLKPDRIEDLIAANALYRPGPMALIPDFIERKHGARWQVPHPIMQPLLEETFGIMIYQEQVMRICNRLGDIPLRKAYALIKAIGKKKRKVIAKQKQQFIQGCAAKGLKEKLATEIFELIEKFAGYGFNKSHATRYSFIAYQTAYLKTYWPVEFMAALLTYEMGNTDKVVEYIGECSRMDIKVLGPDINESFSDFTVVYDRDHEHKSSSSGIIRFGLTAVKGVGEKAVERIITAREKVGRFRSLYHFCENVELRAANKQVLDALIKAGSFDRLGGSRTQMMAGLEKAMQAGANLQSDIRSGQLNLFGSNGSGDDEQVTVDHDALPDVAPWPEMQMLTYEKEVLGFYVTSNPLSKHANTIRAYSTVDTGQLSERFEGRQVVVGGMVTKIRNMVTRNGPGAGAKMAVFTLQDLQADCEVVMFPKALRAFGGLLDVDQILFVKGKVDCRREKPNIICDELIMLKEAPDKLATSVWIRLDSEEVTQEKISKIRSVCEKHKGKVPIHVSVVTKKGFRIRAVADKKLNVRADVDFCRKLEAIVGAGNVELGR